jgi:carboxylesterase type B
MYSGAEMVEFYAGKAIMVTINYRLNAFGFLGSEMLRSLDTESGSTGNTGIQDQRMAFQWVQDNIGEWNSIYALY